MVMRLIGRKLGMTQIYNEKGQCFPATVIEAGPCTVTQVKTKENDGYAALQIAFGRRRKKNVSRAELGHLIPRKAAAPAEGDDKAGKPEDRKKSLERALKELKEAPEVIREIPWDGKETFKVGDQINVSIFESWKKIDVVGTSKGRGFMGVVRRWGFHGLPATHGQSDRERAPGSLGRQHSISQGVYPGKKMAGHWGVEQVTSRNLDVLKVNKERNLLFVHGAVPGPTGGIVLLKEAHWTPPKPSTVVSKKQGKPAGKK
jgi:large subunit ribosomal protein L3